jgi:hypothetical protein
MEPLDLRSAPPRSPRVRVAGIVFTARVIDKLRAALPGGEPNGYFPFIGFSVLWAHYTSIDLHALQGIVASAASEAEVEAWIAAATAGIDTAVMNAKMERFDSARTPEALRAIFDETYPAELRARHANVFDLLEADDARLYGT